MADETAGDKEKRRSITWFRLTLALTSIWATILAAFAVLRHERLNSSAYDLAIKSQVIWNTAQGNLFASSIEVSHYLGDHVQPIMLLLAPLFWIWADVNVLLVVQALLLSLGAIPVYRIAHRTLQNKRLAFVFAAAYLLYPTIGFVNRFDFHPLTFSILFLLLAVDYLGMERPGWASFFVFLALMTREDVGFTVFALGLYVLIVSARRRRLGAAWAIAGLTWSLLTIFVVIPHFRGEASDTVARYAWLGDSLPQIARTAITSPGLIFEHVLGDPLRRRFLARLLLPVGYLSLLAPGSLLVGLPALAYNLLSETPSQSSVYFQYISPIIPFIFIAAIQGTARARRWLERAIPSRRVPLVIGAWLAVAVLASWALYNPFTTTIEDPYYPVYGLEPITNRQAFLAAAQLLPPDAAVATMPAYAPHLALRPQLSLFYDRLRLEERKFGFPQSEYALLNLSDLRWGVNARIFYAAIETAIGRYGYEALFFEDDIVLLARHTEPQPATGAVLQRVRALANAGGKFAPTAPGTLAWLGEQWVQRELPEGTVARDVTFAQGVVLRGYELSANEVVAGRPLCVTLYWETEKPLDVAYTAFVHLAAPDGYVHGQRDSQPAFGFYPTTKWQPGEIVGDMHCFRTPPPLPAGTYQLLAGMYDANSGERLPLTGPGESALSPNAALLTPVAIR